MYVDVKLFTDCQVAFFEVKDINGVLINEKYKDYFMAFKFDINPNQPVAGSVQAIGVKNVLLFAVSSTDEAALAHERLHGLGLWHAHNNNKKLLRPDRKFVFRAKTTTNIMSYSSGTFSTWHWQWQIINPNIKLQ